MIDPAQFVVYTVKIILMVFVVFVKRAGMDLPATKNVAPTVSPMTIVALCTVAKRLGIVGKDVTQPGMVAIVVYHVVNLAYPPAVTGILESVLLAVL